MLVQKYTRPRSLGDLLAYELDQQYCRENVTLAGLNADTQYTKFTVLGEQTLGAETVTATKTGTGTGVIAGATVAAGTPPGNYKAVCIGVAANGGEFEFSDPNGHVLGTFAVGAAFTLGGITATVADGGTDWADGDIVTYAVAAATASGKYAEVSATAVDGTQNAAGILINDVFVSANTDTAAAILARGPMVVRAAELIWPAGATNPQIAAWTAQLVALGILCRPSF